jgi:hypothetical protein
MTSRQRIVASCFSTEPRNVARPAVVKARIIRQRSRICSIGSRPREFILQPLREESGASPANAGFARRIDRPSDRGGRILRIGAGSGQTLSRRSQRSPTDRHHCLDELHPEPPTRTLAGGGPDACVRSSAAPFSFPPESVLSQARGLPERAHRTWVCPRSATCSGGRSGREPDSGSKNGRIDNSQDGLAIPDR